jgi:hypothetical protein
VLPRSVAVPVELERLYQAAKRSFTYAEEASGLWDFPSLPLFRDALDHIMQASTASTVEEERHHLSIAVEHLGMVAAEPMQDLAKRRVLAAQKLDRRRWYRQLYRQLPSRPIVAKAAEEVTESMMLGRLRKGKQTAEGWIDAAEAFERAYTRANFLYALIDSAPLRARPVFLFLAFMVPVVLGVMLQRIADVVWPITPN